jgi:hypothetical protein
MPLGIGRQANVWRDSLVAWLAAREGLETPAQEFPRTATQCTSAWERNVESGMKDDRLTGGGRAELR